MGFSFNVGDLVSFKYSGGSNPGKTRVVKVTEREGNRFKGVDLTKGCGDNFRNFNDLMVTELDVVVENADGKNVAVLDRKWVLAKLGLVHNESLKLSDNFWEMVLGELEDPTEAEYWWVGDYEYLVRVEEKATPVDVDGEATLMVSNSKGKVLTLAITDGCVTVSVEDSDENVDERVLELPTSDFDAVKNVLSLVVDFVNG